MRSCLPIPPILLPFFAHKRTPLPTLWATAFGRAPEEIFQSHPEWDGPGRTPDPSRRDHPDSGGPAAHSREALSFVFSLRSIVRDVVPEAEANPAIGRISPHWTERSTKSPWRLSISTPPEERKCSQLRINEVKRQVAWVMGKMNQQDEGPEELLEDSSQKTSTYENVHREDL